ncbi:MAG: site-2 protease family protein [Micrococcales bacterium]|nr:site-2 protease family protein [Micrococcales bacterium]
MHSQGPGLRIATIAGVPVFIGASWLVLAAIITATVGTNVGGGGRGYLVGFGYALLLLVAVLVHEAAHAVAARGFGMPVHRVVADIWGGHTAYEAGQATPASTAGTAVAGPLANLGLAGVGWVLGRSLDGLPGAFGDAFAFMNGLLAVFNLLPGLPLDGGQLVDAAVWKATGSRGKGRRAAGLAGRVVTVLVVLWFVGRPLLRGQSPDLVSIMWTLMIASFLWAGATAAIKGGQALEVLGAVPLASVLREALPVPATATLDSLGGARGIPVVMDATGARPVGLIVSEDLAGIPPEQRGAVQAGQVCRAQPQDWVVEADPSGDIVPAVAGLQALETGIVAVLHQGRLVGVVAAADVNAALEGK